jgi:predicted secreted protein
MAHCLLNQNTRYPGGAVCAGVVTGAVDPYVNEGIGIVQMECPEQRAWGGVLKRHFLWLIDHPRMARVSGALSKPLTGYLRARYRPIAARAVRDMEDYQESGFEVVGVVGVAGSPSCGVNTTLDLGRALEAIGSCPLSGPATSSIIQPVVEGSSMSGQGLFIEALADGMDRRHIHAPLDEVTLSQGGLGVPGETS